jgi:hypothetical protein
VIVLTADSGPEIGYYMSGNKLFSYCSAEHSVQNIACSAYVLGVADLMEIDRASDGKGECIPEKVEKKQVIDVVTEYLRTHPALRDHAAADIARVAITEAWNCH